MLGYLIGTVTEQYENQIILEVNGIGYEIFMSGKLPEFENTPKIYIYENIKEDIYDLYGFLTLQEKLLFKKLISVNGIGPKAAAGLMGLHGINLVSYIINADSAAITQVSGIGAKIANRLILELKDKLNEFELIEHIDIKDTVPDLITEAISALVALGYNKKEATKAVNAIYIYSDSVEEIIKKALGLLM
ncbi:Holliday junction DNA helicase RuvA [Candidatus Epulonipiscioides gigas]|nr:Holliday junction DNA helicase RuvA [Epulopiscium sp. SCG-C07WGA-EpuloA2]